MTLSTLGIQAQHQQALDQGRFLIQQCGACGRHIYFPRELCPHCGALSPELVAPAGGGTVEAVTTNGSQFLMNVAAAIAIFYFGRLLARMATKIVSLSRRTGKISPVNR